ncbi:MAG: type III pantothenate kinase, partial [Candidatus Omnitrophota bacterium]
MSKNVKDQYLAAVDIGNTAVHVAVLKGLRVVAERRILSGRSVSQMKKEIAAFGRDWAQTETGISGVMICSVVPPLTGRVGSVCRTAFGCKPVIVGKDVIPP